MTRRMIPSIQSQQSHLHLLSSSQKQHKTMVESALGVDEDGDIFYDCIEVEPTRERRLPKWLKHLSCWRRPCSDEGNSLKSQVLRKSKKRLVALRQKMRRSRSSQSEQGTASISLASIDEEESSLRKEETTCLREETRQEKQEVPSMVALLGPHAGTSTRQIKKDLSSDELLSLLEKQEEEDICDGQHENEFEQNRKGVFWRQIKGEELLVRSREYTTTGVKEPSNGELYEAIATDVLLSPRRIPQVSSRVELPQLSYDSEDATRTKTWHAPDVFVVTLSLPLETQGNTEEAPCLTISTYFGMKPETRRILQHLTDPNKSHDPSCETWSGEEDQSKVNAVRLFNEWCRLSPTDPSFQSRFKVIPHVANMDQLGVPSWISRWNGKPVLIKRAGKTGFLYHQQENCLEMEVSFHPFPWAAKQAIDYLRKEIFHKVLLTLGFVIEARGEEELPECVIGCTQLLYPKAEDAALSTQFFGE